MARNLRRGADSIPRWIDPDELSRSARELRGSMQWQDLDRVAAAGAVGRSPRVHVRVAACREPGGSVIVEGHVEARVAVQCQRCLGDVELPVEAGFVVAVARSAAEAARLREDYDTVELGRGERLPLGRLIEDEILLAIPMVPRHPHRDACDAEAVARLEALSAGAPVQDNPFQVLERLRRGKN